MLDVSLIKDLPPFSGMELSALEKLISVAKSLRVKKNAAIFEQEEAAHSFFVLLDGHIRVVKITPEGEQVIARYISSGELFGIAPAIGRTTYPAYAYAAVDCVALAWPTEIWQPTVRQHPEFAENTYKTLGKRLEETREQMIEMATSKVEQRVAHAVAKLAKQSARQTDEGLLIDFPISRQDISEMTGTTLHTVSRLLSRWEDEGIVKCGRQRLWVVDTHELAQKANPPD